jgi:hypothetical protein
MNPDVRYDTSNTLSDDDKEYMTKIPYKSAVGSLVYLAITCRPDIAYAVGILSRYMQSPAPVHWEGVKNVMRYLKGTMELGLTYGGSNVNQLNKDILYAYCDSDWAGDRQSRRSLSGYILMLNGGPVQWKSQLQPTVAQSSTEAEYISLAYCGNEVVNLRTFLHFIGFVQHKPTNIYEDNTSCLKMAYHPKDDKRTRHVHVRYHITKERIQHKIITILPIRGTENPADMNTKAERSAMFSAMRKTILRA